MNDEKFAAALKNHPCPECNEVGHLQQQHMTIRVTHKGQLVFAEGEGTVCNSCNHKFMSDALTESIANQVQRIDGGIQRYIEINRATGELKGHPIN